MCVRTSEQLLLTAFTLPGEASKWAVDPEDVNLEPSLTPEADNTADPAAATKAAKGFFESAEDFAGRQGIAQAESEPQQAAQELLEPKEASEGFFESAEDFTKRQKAAQGRVEPQEAAQGLSQPREASQGFFESAEDFAGRQGTAQAESEPQQAAQELLEPREATQGFFESAGASADHQEAAQAQSATEEPAQESLAAAGLVLLCRSPASQTLCACKACSLACTRDG